MKQNTEWISISDIMSGLMVVFLFITVALLIVKNDEINDIREAKEILENSSDAKKELSDMAAKYSKLKSQVKMLQNKVKDFDVVKHSEVIESINDSLHREFDEDLERWGAKINSDNSIVFNHPTIYFDSDKSEIRPEFKKILSEFFPRYIALFADTEYSTFIKNIKIEGHTSSVYNWNRFTKGQEQYFNQMELSQERANSVLKYCYKDLPNYENFLKNKLESSGLSFSQAVKLEDNTEDISSSHRVTFRLSYNE